MDEHREGTQRAGAYLTRWAAQVEAELERLLPAESEPTQVLHRAMRYATLSPGKLLRAGLAVAACEAVGADGDRALALGAAIEMIHAYSLVHDDLPAMDDDDWRRGRPSCHRAFGEGIAILAGDALQTLAFEVLSQLPARAGIQPATAVAVSAVLARAAGSRGMAGGQAADLAAVGRAVDAATLSFIHRHKTGALIRASLVSGALVGLDEGEAGLRHPAVEALGRFGESLGVAFQIVDDLLDAGDERKAHEASYARLLGAERAVQEADRLTQEARAALQALGPSGELLGDMARLLRHREA
ncbi:MAG: polyprenyl synthetase family protein [Firmicutes bacterium]|nr:polyprenyl synthetase family protein [Bacillota bacterium]